MVVNVQKHLVVGQASALHECALELDELVFTSGRGRVEHENDSMGALLHRAPSLLVTPVTRDIPELNVHFAEDAGLSGSVLLVLNNPSVQRAKSQNSHALKTLSDAGGLTCSRQSVCNWRRGPPESHPKC